MLRIYGLIWFVFCSSIAHAAVSYVGQNTNVATSSVSSLSVSPVSGTVQGDLLLAHITVRSNNTPTAPAGWTLVYNNTIDNVRQMLWYQTVPLGGVGAQTFTFSTSGRAVLGISTLRGADQLNPISNTGHSSGSGTTATAPSINASTTDGYVLAYFAGDNGNQAFTLSTSGRLSAWSFNTTGGTSAGVAGAMWHFAKASTGATGTTVAGFSNDAWRASTVVIAAGDPFTCFGDDFNRGTGVGADWTVASSSGSFGDPQIVSNRLRLTNASANVATAATLQRLFPGAGNYIELEFTHYAYGGNGADGITIILSDATITPQPGGYGGSLGYAQRTGIDGFAGGWIGIGLDEYGNFSNPTEGRQLGPGFRVDSVALRGSGSGTTGYRYIAGTTTLSPGVDQNSAGHRYRIRIDARTSSIPVTIERDTGAGYSTLVSVANIASATGQAALPENLFLSMTGSTGGANNIHEIDNLGVCAQKMNPVTAQIDHFDFTPQETPLTCKPTPITVSACMDAACTSTFPGNVTVNLAPTGWVEAQPVTLTNGVGTFNFRRTTIGAQTNFNVTSSSVPVKAFSQVTCNNTRPCSITWQDSGFVFTLPTMTSNKPTAEISLRALKTSGTPPTEHCAPAWSGSRSVGFYSSYLTPNSGTLAMAVRDTNTATLTNIGQSLATRTNLNLQFNANAEAKIVVRYPDAGRVQLNAYYQGGIATGDSGLILQGQSDNVAMPAGFCVQAMQIANNALPQSACLNATCPAYQVAGGATPAGAQFPMRIRAMAWELDGELDAQFCTGNAVTPNFQQNPLSVSSVRAPDADLSANGVLGVNSTSITAAGTVAINNQTLSEVGRFKFNVGGDNYLGLTLPITGSDFYGRFIPANYLIGINQYDKACSSQFTYAGSSSTPIKTGQSFPLNITVTARNLSNNTTQNYQGSYAKLTGLTYSDWSGGLAVTDGDFSITAPLSFLAGVSTNAITNATYNFSSVHGPRNIALRANAADSDGVTGVATSTTENDYRLGRLSVENAYGPEQIALPIPLRTEYFDGTRYRLNTLDSCTTYQQSSASLIYGSLPAGTTSIAGPGTTQSLANGVSSTTNPLLLSASGLGNTGSVNVVFTPPAAAPSPPAPLPWLFFDWDGDGTVEYPTGTATFGRYRGSDRVIYWREQRAPIP